MRILQPFWKNTFDAKLRTACKKGWIDALETSNGRKMEDLRADHKQADRASLSWSQWIDHHHPYPKERIICANAHVHQWSKCNNLLSGISRQSVKISISKVISFMMNVQASKGICMWLNSLAKEVCLHHRLFKCGHCVFFLQN